MFYSHQLLARKTPLGQIWMAATLHAKINRRKLDKLNIIRICEEILYPSVPMALRLSGILMGGVVIVYERKVKLLYDDVNRLLVEINEAWKVKAVQDPTMLPKGKTKAKYESVTLPENHNTDVGEAEHSLNYSNATMKFQQTEYFAMRLDDIGETFFTSNTGEENLHQADPADITTNEYYNPYQANTDFSKHFERFDIAGDGDTQVNFNTTVHMEIPTLEPSPPFQDELPLPRKTLSASVISKFTSSFLIPEEIKEQCPEQVHQQSDENVQTEKDQPKGPTKRIGRRLAPYIMDYNQTIIPGQVFQSWLQSASDVVGRKKRRLSTGGIPMKLSYQMELPPHVLLCGLFTNGDQEVYYPAPLLELWMRSTQLPHDSPSGRTSAPQPPEPSSSSPPNGINYQSPVGNLFDDINGGFDPEPIERLRKNVDNDVIQIEKVVGLNTTTGVGGIGERAQPNGVVTPGNSGDDVRSIPSAGSGNSFPSFTSHISSGRLNRKRPYSLSGQDGLGLEPVTEELYPQDLNFKLARLHNNGISPENEPLVETEPTQTQKPLRDHPVDKITDALRMNWKHYFDTPGVLPTESLDNLTSGISRKKAAQLFYQTCVLASLDFLKVEQNVAYGDILISRGSKM